MKLFVVCGPTCTGKTALAHRLCKKYSGEIISADSRQIYKYMDIGTGKLPLRDAKTPVVKAGDCWTFDGVSVWGYDLVTPDRYFSAYAFAVYTQAKIAEINARGKIAFLVGGTGFYIDAALGNLNLQTSEPDLSARTKLEKLSNEELLSKLSPDQYPKDIKNKVRLVRAVEKSSTSNKLSTLATLNPDLVVGLTASRERLYKRADTWVDFIWQNGLVEEVKNLVLAGYRDSPKLGGLIYKSVLAFVEGLTTKEQAIERCKFDTHAYIRRQQTYFKRNPNISWFDMQDSDKINPWTRI